ncbi:MAG: glycosyltransferase family 4 protein [Myxococcota bacterium]
MKRFILSRFDLIAVPGEDGVRFTRELLDVPQPTVILPNLVNETLFRNATADDADSIRRDLGLPAEKKLALLPARLAPEKGILELLKTLEHVSLAEWRICIVGEGPLGPSIAEWLSTSRLSGFVSVIGYLPYERMPALYRAADLFVLPSLYDPNPLSVVEALHAGLPLLVSRRLGNLPEALRQGENGFSFEPDDSADALRAAKAAFEASREKLAIMGQSSLVRARFWQTEGAVARFLDTIEEKLRTNGERL